MLFIPYYAKNYAGIIDASLLIGIFNLFCVCVLNFICLFYFYSFLAMPVLCFPHFSAVWTAQIGHVACSLLTIMEFGLDESTRREPKGCCLPVW